MVCRPLRLEDSPANWLGKVAKIKHIYNVILLLKY